ncbi:MAG: hypothetical protein GY847_14935, partial [Proteobacteria bacterium]|nr:hypothetical protein [Pseudomonadota bacterium]
KNAVGKFDWMPECQTEFETVRVEFAKNLHLAFPDFSKKFSLERGASKEGVGACLSQSYPINETSNRTYLHPIEFGSRTTNGAEKRYCATELEAMAVIYALRKFYPVIAGCMIKLYTDHMPLTFIYKLPSSDNHRLAKFITACQGFDLKIYYKTGNRNIVADALSRTPWDPAPKEEGLEFDPE